MQNKSNQKGFTLIELLVVIAIIGILAGLMFPAITGAIESATAVRVGNQGKGVVTAIIAENLNREAANSVSIWPIADKIDPDYNNSDMTGNPLSNKYFWWLIEDQVVESLNGLGPFAGGGVGMASDTDKFKDGEYNIWNLVANLEQSPIGDPPFMFTRNFYVDPTEIKNESADAKRWKNDIWHKNIKPFGGNRCVTVSRGAAVAVIRSRDMTRARFIGDAVFNNETNKEVEIWYAKGAESAP